MKQQGGFIFLATAIIGAMLFFGVSAARAEEMTNDIIAVNVNADASLTVSQQLTYDFGLAGAHDLTLRLPLFYHNDKNAYDLYISDIKATDGGSIVYKVNTSRQAGDLLLTIVAKNEGQPGIYNYLVSYTVQSGILFYGSFDEALLPVVSNRRDYILDAAQVTVNLPANSRLGDGTVDCSYGSADNRNACAAASSSPTTLMFKPTGGLSSDQGVSLTIDLLKNIVHQPAWWFRLWWAVLSHQILWADVGLFFVLAVCWLIGWRRRKYSYGSELEDGVPDNLSPMEIDTLLNEHASRLDMAAELIHLALDGVLSIRRTDLQNLTFKVPDYLLIKLKPNEEINDVFHQKLMMMIFDGHTEVRVSDLRGVLAHDFEKISQSVALDLRARGYFVRSGGWLRFLLATLGGLGIFAGYIVYAQWAMLNYFDMIATVVAAALLLVFGLTVPQVRPLGLAMKDRIYNFRQYLARPNADNVTFHNDPGKELWHFEQFLPYAMIFGVTNEWARQFRNTYNQPLTWYIDPTYTENNAVRLVDKLSQFSLACNQALSLEKNQDKMPTSL